MDPSHFRAVFLSGDLVYIRAYVEDDKDVAMAWANSPFPTGSPRGASLLADWHQGWQPRPRRYALCRASDDRIVGGVILGIRNLVAEFKVTLGSTIDDADQLRAAAFELIVPWLIDEWTMVSVTAHIAADQPLTLAAAERLDMSHQATLREFYARPGGSRVDELLYQAFGRMEAGLDA